MDGADALSDCCKNALPDGTGYQGSGQESSVEQKHEGSSGQGRVDKLEALSSRLKPGPNTTETVMKHCFLHTSSW